MDWLKYSDVYIYLYLNSLSGIFDRLYSLLTPHHHLEMSYITVQ